MALAADPDIVSKRDLPHLLQRVLATTVSVRELRHNFDVELRRRTEAQPRNLRPTLSPQDAARYLTPDQLRQLFDKFSQERLDALQAIQQRASDEADRLAAVSYEVETLLGELTVDPGAPKDLVEKLVEVLGVLRGSAPTV